MGARAGAGECKGRGCFGSLFLAYMGRYRNRRPGGWSGKKTPGFAVSYVDKKSGEPQIRKERECINRQKKQLPDTLRAPGGFAVNRFVFSALMFSARQVNE